jgi:hypothetical protein
MKLQHYKLIFIAVGLIGLLLITTPALSMVLYPSPGEEFSELYLLGPEHEMGNYPFNVTAGQNYSLYVGVGNHLSSSAYYVLYVKFGAPTELPNTTSGFTTGSPSSLPTLFESRFLLKDGNNSESLLTFSISDVSFSSNQSLVKTLEKNGVTFNVNETVAWDTEHKGFYYELIVELWIYNVQSNSIEYDNRYVNLPLNITSNMPSP